MKKTYFTPDISAAQIEMEASILSSSKQMEVQEESQTERLVEENVDIWANHF